MGTEPDTAAPPDPDEEGGEPSAIEEAAGEQLGVEPWDRPLIYRDAARAAVDNGVPYWTVLVLSGAIATLGLALDSTAVVIGAMLVAPLLAPIVGLSLALAVGDSRLALQCFAVVVGSLVAVVATAAGLTALLPFHTLTLEITSRIHPTTLDLGVAVCSGLVGALVTVARGQRLSAAIPGVAVAVALIPPLAVAGFGMAAGWQTDVIWGSLLLLGANLAGIVLSGVAVFLLIGMHRSDVVAAAREWHQSSCPRGVAGLAGRLPGAGRMGVFGNAVGRTALVLAFVVALAVPLSAAFREVAREARVRAAIEEALPLLEEDGATSVLGRQVELGPDSAVVVVRVTTPVGVSTGAREAFRTRASELGGEPVALRLVQLAASPGDASALQALLRGGDGVRLREEPGWPETVARARDLLESATWTLPFPDGAEPVAVTLRLDGGPPDTAADSVEVGYLAAEPLAPQAAAVLERALRRAVGHPGLAATFVRAGPAVLHLLFPDTVGLGAWAEVAGRRPGLAVEVRGPPTAVDAVDAVVARLRAAGADAVAVTEGGGGTGDGDDPGAGVVEVRVARRGG